MYNNQCKSCCKFFYASMLRDGFCLKCLPSLNKISTELMLKIADYLEPTDIHNLRLVGRRARDQIPLNEMIRLQLQRYNDFLRQCLDKKFLNVQEAEWIHQTRNMSYDVVLNHGLINPFTNEILLSQENVEAFKDRLEDDQIERVQACLIGGFAKALFLKDLITVGDLLKYDHVDDYHLILSEEAFFILSHHLLTKAEFLELIQCSCYHDYISDFPIKKIYELLKLSLIDYEQLHQLSLLSLFLAAGFIFQREIPKNLVEDFESFWSDAFIEQLKNHSTTVELYLEKIKINYPMIIYDAEHEFWENRR